MSDNYTPSNSEIDEALTHRKAMKALLRDGDPARLEPTFQNPQPDLSENLGTLEIKAESLRYVVCATSDLLQDASFNVESWLLEKVSRRSSFVPGCQTLQRAVARFYSAT